jgi:DNA-binding PadR family transcriptional regulator
MDISKLTRGVDIASPTYALLTRINGQTFGELEQESGLPTSTLKYQLRQLREKGYIDKNADEQDKRKHHYHRTDDGEDALRTRRGFSELPSPRAGWKRSDLNHSGQPRYQRKYRNEDGSIGYGQPKNLLSRNGSTSEGGKGQPPTSTSSKSNKSSCSYSPTDTGIRTGTIGTMGVDPIANSVSSSSPNPIATHPRESAHSQEPPSQITGTGHQPVQTPPVGDDLSYPLGETANGPTPRTDPFESPKLEGEDLEWAKVMVARGILKPEVVTRGR